MLHLLQFVEAVLKNLAIDREHAAAVHKSIDILSKHRNHPAGPPLKIKQRYAIHAATVGQRLNKATKAVIFDAHPAIERVPDFGRAITQHPHQRVVGVFDIGFQLHRSAPVGIRQAETFQLPLAGVEHRHHQAVKPVTVVIQRQKPMDQMLDRIVFQQRQ
ncbi:hypothetical protein D3C75_1012350 [compost metagenome]